MGNLIPGSIKSFNCSYRARYILSPITEKDIKDVVFGSRSEGRLVHGSGEKLRVPDDDVGVVDAELFVACVRLALCHQVGLDAGPFVGSQHQTEDLNLKI